MSITGVESSGNPFVIANVTDGVSYYLASEEEAIAKARLLSKQGKNFSAGLMQVNSKNFQDYSLSQKQHLTTAKISRLALKSLKNAMPEPAQPLIRHPTKGVTVLLLLRELYAGLSKRRRKKILCGVGVSHADDSNNVPSVSILKNDPDLNQAKKAPGMASKEQFFITDTHASEPVQEHMDNDDVCE
ncbi:lytic transglycosylase domain-containing protein [Klebsiella variicola]|uniref:lytic transglycosylase domain-containing protein n=1 Tax=Klebsiella variicola TaxID=244366 RepID=UPI0013C368A2|nr:lytic transglycosylase domain-containing protein [Klebsiella variicola]